MPLPRHSRIHDRASTRWPGDGYWLLVGVILAGAALRLPGLFANSFHSDEALFATWARWIATGRGPLLANLAVDKPPLLFYLQALFYPVLGTPAPWVARMPDLIASLLLLPVAGQLAWRLSRRPLTAWLTVLLLLLSPLVIQFSATAFTDPLLTLWLTLALFAAARRPAGLGGGKTGGPGLVAGLAFGAAVLTKHQAWLFLPLLVGLGLWRGWGRADWWRLVAAVGAAVALLGLWEATRGAGPSLWNLQLRGFGGLRLAWPWELGSRLIAWARQLRLLAGTTVGAGLVLLVLGAAPIISRHNRLAARRSVLDNLLTLFVVAYLLLHWLLAVPVWDRYLLPLAPIIALLIARSGTQIVDRLASKPAGRRGAILPDARWLSLLGLVLLLAQLPVAWAARSGAYPVGGRPAADQGAAILAAYLQDAPWGTVLYDHWYSWQWRYYFLEGPIYTSWFAHPTALADDLSVHGSGPELRYLVWPAGASIAPLARELARVHYALRPAGRFDGLALYHLAPVSPAGG